jgi:hypothetical protein
MQLRKDRPAWTWQYVSSLGRFPLFLVVTLLAVPTIGIVGLIQGRWLGGSIAAIVGLAAIGALIWYSALPIRTRDEKAYS